MQKVPVHVQKLIKKRIAEKKLNLIDVARLINVSKASFYHMLDRRTMQIDRLWSLCIALDINLFQEIANHLEIDHYSPAVEKKEQEIEEMNDKMQQLNQEIDNLKKEIELIKRERDSFKEAISLMKG